MMRLRRHTRTNAASPPGQAPAHTDVDTGPEIVDSQIMSQILEDLRGLEQLVVLDLGFGGQETVSAFSGSGRRCRLHFAGMLEVLQSADSPAEEGADALDEEHWFRLFNTELDRFGEEHFDLLLFWDFFNYLDDAAVRAFNRALAPRILATSRGHGFLAPNAGTPVPGRRFAMDDEGRLILRTAPAPARPVMPRPHGRLGNLLSSMVRGQGVLRPGGLLEFSLKGA